MSPPACNYSIILLNPSSVLNTGRAGDGAPRPCPWLGVTLFCFTLWSSLSCASTSTEAATHQRAHLKEKQEGKHNHSSAASVFWSNSVGAVANGSVSIRQESADTETGMKNECSWNGAWTRAMNYTLDICSFCFISKRELEHLKSCLCYFIS